MSRLREYVERRELLHNLILRELRSRYKKSVLGWSWSLLNPLSAVAIYSIVFSVFLKIDPPRGDPSGLKSFVLFLLCALVPWNFFSGSLTTSVESIVGNANLVKKVYFPRELLVIANVASLIVTLLIEMGVLVVILLFAGNMVLPWIPMALVLVLLEAMLVIGIGLVLSVCNVYFRDVRYFMTIVIQALFYSAPVVYPVSLVPDRRTVLGIDVPIGDIYRLNPLVRMMEAFRSVLYDLRFPDVGDLLYLAAWSAALLAFGLSVFSRLDGRLAEEVCSPS